MPLPAVLMTVAVALQASPEGAQEEKRQQLVATIRRLYDVDISRLSGEERRSKSKERDAFRKLLKDDKPTYLPLLREQLRTAENPPLFHFDGATLLHELAREPDDLQLMADAIARVELKGLSHRSYFGFAHALATEGADVTGAVGRILDTPVFEVYLVDHALTIGQVHCVQYLVLLMKDELYMEKLALRLKMEKDEAAAKSILLCLASTVTEKGRKALEDFARTTASKSLAERARQLATFATRKELPAASVTAKREHFTAFLDDYVAREFDNPAYDFETYEKEAPHLVVKDDYARIKELRRKQAARVSDEALEEIEYLTRLLQLAFTAEK